MIGHSLVIVTGQLLLSKIPQFFSLHYSDTKMPCKTSWATCTTLMLSPGMIAVDLFFSSGFQFGDRPCHPKTCRSCTFSPLPNKDDFSHYSLSTQEKYSHNFAMQLAQLRNSARWEGGVARCNRLQKARSLTPCNVPTKTRCDSPIVWWNAPVMQGMPRLHPQGYPRSSPIA